MAKEGEFDHVMPDLERTPPPRPEKIEENLGMRLLTSVILMVLLSFANTILTIVTVLQFILTLINNHEPNQRLAEFGIDLGTWIAKAARYQAMGSEEKPWPWTPWDE